MSVAELLQDPRARPNRPLPMQVRRSASISLCGTYRWSLRRWWGLGGAILPWIMLNPSTADGDIDDPTLNRIVGFSWRWGFDGLLVVNLFPFRSSKPSDLREWLRWDERQDWDARDAILANHDQVADLLTPFDAAMASWGSQPGLFGYDAALTADSVLDAINDPEAVKPPATRKRVLELFCLGVAGEPKHPMARGCHRVPDHARPVPIGHYPGTVRAAPFETAS